VNEERKVAGNEKNRDKKDKMGCGFGVFVDRQDSTDTVRRASSVNFERNAEIRRDTQ
jgi:hypothetical protein